MAAFTIIATVRGFLLNFGVYYACRAALGLPFAWSPHIRCARSFESFGAWQLRGGTPCTGLCCLEGLQEAPALTTTRSSLLPPTPASDAPTRPRKPAPAPAQACLCQACPCPCPCYYSRLCPSLPLPLAKPAPAPLSAPARSFITVFVTLFAVVIAITKDLPDVEGDRQHGIQTFATQLGVRCARVRAGREGAGEGEVRARSSQR